MLQMWSARTHRTELPQQSKVHIIQPLVSPTIDELSSFTHLFLERGDLVKSVNLLLESKFLFRLGVVRGVRIVFKKHVFSFLSHW